MATKKSKGHDQTANAPSQKAAKAALRVAAPAPERAAAAAEDRAGALTNECCCVHQYWAVVETDGTLVRGNNVWRATRLAEGQYEVIFTGDVSGGAYVASIGRPGIATEPAGEIGVALRCCLNPPEQNKGVWVDTHDSGGSYSDRAFHLIVLTA
jgi:hypothetical protein